MCTWWKINTCYPYNVDKWLVKDQATTAIHLMAMACMFALAKSVGCNFIITPESLALKSSASSLSPAGLVPQAWWHWSQSACTDRRGAAAHRRPPLHLRQDSTAPFPRGRSLRPGWNTGRWVKRSQEWSGMTIQRTGQAGSKFESRSGPILPSWTRFPSSWFAGQVSDEFWVLLYFQSPADWLFHQFIWTICKRWLSWVRL